MKYIQYTQVDSVTGISVARAPASHGPAFPAVEGLAFEWARESQYPTSVPEFFGTCPDDSATQVNGVIAVLTEADYKAAFAQEMDARAQLIKESIQQQAQQRLDDFAATRDYSSILSACTYATSTVDQFRSDGQYAVEARDATWGALYLYMQDVESGKLPMPEGYHDVEPSLPPLQWPV